MSALFVFSKRNKINTTHNLLSSNRLQIVTTLGQLTQTNFTQSFDRIRSDNVLKLYLANECEHHLLVGRGVPSFQVHPVK